MTQLLVFSSKFEPRSNNAAFASSIGQRCKEILGQARRDGVSITHVFPDWPSMRAPLPDCQPFRFETVATSISAAVDAIAQFCSRFESDEPLELKYCGTLSIETKVAIERRLKPLACRLEPIADAVIILDHQTHDRFAS